MRPAARLLLLEAEALPAVLAGRPAAAFDRDTLLVGWNVRDVLAHCAAALGHLVDGDPMVFTPEANQVDVDVRRELSVDQVLRELYDGYPQAAAVIDHVGGAADGLALGEWIHGGDVRDALGAPDAYRSAGVELALPLLSARSVERHAIGVRVEADGEFLPFGEGDTVAHLTTDTATFVRLCAGRAPDAGRFHLDGAHPRQLVLFS